MASGLQNVYASPEGNVDELTTTLATDGPLSLGSLSFLVFSPSFENLVVCLIRLALVYKLGPNTLFRHQVCWNPEDLSSSVPRC